MEMEREGSGARGLSVAEPQENAFSSEGISLSWEKVLGYWNFEAKDQTSKTLQRQHSD